MASPFNVFRKNQRIGMAVLTGLAMISFVVLGTIQDFDPATFSILIGAICGALALWLLSGKGGGEGWAIAAVGAVIGAVVGWYGPTFLGNNTVVQTADGNLSARDIERINQEQNLANDFLRLATQTIAERMEKADADKPPQQREQPPQPQPFGFIPTTNTASYRENAVMTFLFENEADDLGIHFSDEAVTDYLNDAFGHRLTDADFGQIRSQMQVGTGKLMDIFRDQLRVREAFRLTAPPPSGQQSQFAFLMKVWPPTPQQLWSEFKKVNTSAEVTAVAVPAEAFVGEVAEPSDAELAAYFERYKNFLPGLDGSPGFLVPRQFQVAYLEIDADSLKKSVTPPTDAEVRAVYDKTRAQFPNTPAFPGGADQTPPADGTPVEAPKPAPAAAPASGTSGAESAPANPEKPAAPEKPPGESNSALDRDGLEFVAFQGDQPAQAKKPAAAGSESSPAAEPKPAPAGDNGPSVTPPEFPPAPAVTKNAAEPSPETLAAIREDLVSQRVRALTDERLKQAREDLYRIIDEVFNKIPIPEDMHDDEAKRKYDQARAAAAREVGERMADYAKQHAKDGIKFHRTPLLSAQELYDSDEYPIGKALLWNENQPFGANTPSVAMQIESTTPDQPLTPIPAQSALNEDRYLAVKVADVPERVSSLDEKSTREKVVKAWKLAQARDLARKRAEDLAKADTADKKLADEVKGQTVTGKPGGQELTARQVGPFTWLRKSTAPPTMMNLPDLVPSTLPQLPGAGEQFMQTVFQKLKPGETGTVPAEDGSAVYVVELDKRTSDEELAKLREGYLKEDFLGMFSPYHMRQLQQAQQLQADWFRAFRERHGVGNISVTQGEPEA
jgi:hypothetical protein